MKRTFIYIAVFKMILIFSGCNDSVESRSHHSLDRMTKTLALFSGNMNESIKAPAEDKEVRQKELSEYINYVTDPSNGLKISRTFGEHTYTLQFKPYGLELLNHIGKRSPDKYEISALSEAIKGTQHYMLSLGCRSCQGELIKHGLSEYSGYEERVRYLAGQAQQDLFLVDGEDTLACHAYHWERNYGVAPVENILLSFPATADESAKDKTLVFYDRIFGNGIIKLKIKGEDIDKCPEINLIQP